MLLLAVSLFCVVRLADPAAGLQVTTKTLNTVQPSSSGTHETTSIEARDVSGSFTVVSFDTQKSDNVHAVNVEIAPKKEVEAAPKSDVETAPKNKEK